MDTEEVKARVTAIERQKARDGRIDWYDRNVPVWWKNLKDLLNDTVWGEDLDDYCVRWFGKSETEMVEFLGLERVEDTVDEPKPERQEPPEFPKSEEPSIAEQLMEKKRARAMTDAERAKAYRERRKQEGK